MKPLRVVQLNSNRANSVYLLGRKSSCSLKTQTLAPTDSKQKDAVASSKTKSKTKSKGKNRTMEMESPVSDDVCRDDDPMCYEYASLRITNREFVMEKRIIEDEMSVLIPQHTLLCFQTLHVANRFVAELSKQGYRSIPIMVPTKVDIHNGIVDLELRERKGIQADRLCDIVSLKIDQEDVDDLCLELSSNIFTIMKHTWTNEFQNRLQLCGVLDRFAIPVDEMRDKLIYDGYNDLDDY